MTTTRACGEVRRELGVYLLGAIAPADRSTVDSHLASCVACRNQLADLAGLPALLRRVPADEVDTLVPADDADDGNTLPDRVLVSLLSQVAKRRRHRVLREMAAAGAAVLAIGAAAAFAAVGAPAHRPASLALSGALTVSGSNPRDDASAVVEYAGQPWGVQLSVQVTGIAAGTRCVFDVTDANGQESEAGSWSVTAGDEGAWYSLSSSVPLSGIRGFVVTAGAQTLVRVAVPVPVTPAPRAAPR